MNNQDNKTIINCHTHVFTIDHVPNEFGKSLMPWPVYKILTIKTIKWYYTNFTSIGSTRYKSFIRKWNKFFYTIKDILKPTVILWLPFVLIYKVLRWLLRIALDFLRWDSIFSDEFKGLIRRYITLARYSIHYKDQASIYTFLKKNYPTESKFIALSMDMEFMEAGKPATSYMDQIEELKRISSRHPELHPFISLDPRRIVKTRKNKRVQDYSEYFETNLREKSFSGIKIYPANGYYPFDKELIPSYEFALKHNIPIITHCNRGPVFYRGRKKDEWKKHPILEYNHKGGDMKPIPLLQKSNANFTSNFTHPMNYHCLLDKNLLSGYLGEDKDLSKLKICLAHFGGNKEWDDYRKDAFNDYNNNIAPVSLTEYNKKINTLTHKNTKRIWWHASWLSVIYDLMVRYDNVHADVSFILYKQESFPLLKYLLHDDKVKHKILFGTDYYVVSQKSVDKVLYQNLRSYLGEELFMMIAHGNAKTFLTR
ncbi:MAG: amidohydrolase family protein [Bacteroidetes bacterium]|nr:amidohydrolase family protein [Bacteroidota bacterium]MBT3749465.1 amidohydrolase family protein [Bacteroidota bacterium]MBT4401000.1 amidohydrolase family protein [Bacteroidota bacterium]MBT4408268.1 amidohydrolase family protein [Bacteroidota bacterium]MBT5426256.1 amidohydrolase family protein [Bacteroidota bacterium]